MIKDYTHKVDNSNTHSTELTIPITFILYKSGNQKLALVKAIKKATLMGLKESKDFMDESIHHPVMFRRIMTISEIDRFREDLANTDAEYDLDDRERIRNKKLIDLGVCDKSDLVDELSNMNIQKVFIGGFSTSKLREILLEAYSNIDEDTLRKMYDNFQIKEYKSLKLD